MKILLVHPDDFVEVGPWRELAWNLIVDLGWSGRYAYSQQTQRLGCRVLSIYDLLDHAAYRDQLRELLSLGLNELLDSESIDWWETFSSYVDQSVGHLMLASALAEQIPEHAQVFSTRPHIATQALSILLKCDIRAFFTDTQAGVGTRAVRFMKRALGLRPSQMVEIAFDKWDTDYRFRRLISQRPSVSKEAAVLLPSAYENVSRAQLAYAQLLPHRRFLLIVTRRSGRRLSLPKNVEVRSLSAYSPRLSPSTESERSRILGMWRKLQNDRFATNPVLGLAARLGTFDIFGGFLTSALRIRDAWREVITKEPLTSVLSGDENNALTRLPITLAKSRKLRTVFCDHGALNMSLGIRPPGSDIYLVPGDMARDYLVEWCSLPADKVVVGAPNTARNSASAGNESRRDWVVFFSAPYELASARTQTFYSELLPELCALARQASRKVIVKLHPFESYRMRKAMIDKALSAEEREFVGVRTGPMTPELLDRAWFTLTVESSVAVESTMNGTPCFLCSWFDGSWYDYGKQFAKYSAGYSLDSPLQVRHIPDLLQRMKVTDEIRKNLQSPISPEHLESLLFDV